MPGDSRCPYLVDDLWWAVYVGREPVAYACTRSTTKQPHVWYLARAAVAEKARGLGLQKRLIRVRCRAAKARGAAWMVTDTTPTNYASANSLMSCGFRLHEPGYRWSFQTGLYWRKKL